METKPVAYSQRVPLAAVGVPRVMAGTLPQELQTQRLAEVDPAILQYLSGGRINISIRTVT